MLKSKIIQIITESLILILSILWFLNTKEYEPIICIIGSLAALVHSLRSKSSPLLSVTSKGNIIVENIDNKIFDKLNDTEIINIFTDIESIKINKLRKELSQKHNINLEDKKKLQSLMSTLKSKKEIIHKILNTYKLQSNGNLPEEYIKSFELFFSGDFSGALKSLNSISNSKYKKLNSINFLLKANIYLMNSEFEQSEIFYLKSIKIYSSWEGIFQLATFYSYMGNKNNALFRYKQSLKLTNNVILLSYTNDLIAIIYSNKNEFVNSKKHYNTSLNLLKRYKKTDSPEYIQRLSSVYNNYGILQIREGNDNKALDCFKKSLLKMELLNKCNYLIDNELVLLLNNLALVDQNNSIKYFSKALNIVKNLLNDDNSNTEYKHTFSLIATNIGVYRVREYKYEEALKYFNKAFSFLSEIVDQAPYEYRITLAACCHNLGNIYEKMEKIDKSKKYYLEAINNYKLILYTNLIYEIDYYKKSVNALAIIYVKERNFKKSQIIQQDLYNYYSSIMIQSKKLAIDRVMLMNNFANICCETKDFKKATDLYKEALCYSKEYINVDPSLFLPYLELTLRHLAILYDNLNKKKEAENFYQESLTVKKNIDKNGYTSLINSVEDQKKIFLIEN